MNPQQETLLKRYVEAVVYSPINLTADRDVRQFWARHVLDAVRLSELVPPHYRKPGTRILDVGSGNGVPGVPLAILNPEWNIEMLDSDNKKCLFIDTFCKSNGIKNAHVIVGRAETLARGALRSEYDIVFSRALGRLRVAVELTGAFVSVGGLLIVPHGTSWDSELKDSSMALELLGLKFINSIEYDLDERKFWALMFSKIVQTPEKYPRAVGIPKKRPL